MPEVVKRTLICDHPDGDGREGTVVYITLAGRRVKVILCPEHMALVDEIVSWGSLDTRDPGPRESRGLGEDRLRSLIVD